ncbi:MAG TPA: aminomethyltransferase family protein [Acidimicrobiia bacterium]|nr:aminomethyltransferase family protein [Acidimicrobiia bacterium]
MIRTTPFHERVAALDHTGLWSHWAGYLVADKYQLSEKFEYFAIRNSAGIFDTSPLYKYRIQGPDAERFLAGVLARDIATCRIGRAQYTIWCDDDGYLIEDGVILRLAGDEFLLSAARPNLAYLSALTRGMAVEIVDESEAWAAIAVQGPRSREILDGVAPDIGGLGYFQLTTTKIADAGVIVSRTGFTGDLGYEVWVPAERALPVWDAVMEAGIPAGLIPFGQIALSMARIEAGLPLIDVDFTSARFAWTPAQKTTPVELGLGWMVSDLDRPFIGRDAIRREIERASSRHRFTGLVVDWQEWDDLFDAAGLIPPKDHAPVEADRMLYDDEGAVVGWASSSMYSPMLQRHIGLARVRPDLAEPGNRVNLEVTIDHRHHTVGAVVTPLPLFHPDRRTA